MFTLLEDLRWGVRILRSSPGLTLTAILTLSLGIAANTTVFGWIDGVLLDPIPGVSRGSELATLETLAPTGDLQSTAYRDYRDYRDSLRQVSGLAASLANVFTVGGEQNPRLLWGEFVSANYFSVMGVKAIRGRTFRPEESGDAPGGPLVVIISDRLWQSVFQRDPAVIGKTLRVNQRELTIVGVIPPEFHGTRPGIGAGDVGSAFARARDERPGPVAAGKSRCPSDVGSRRGSSPASAWNRHARKWWPARGVWPRPIPRRTALSAPRCCRFGAAIWGLSRCCGRRCRS